MKARLSSISNRLHSDPPATAGGSDLLNYEAHLYSVTRDARGRLCAHEERLDVAVVKVLGDVAADHLSVLLQHPEVAFAHLGRDLVADVQELAQGRVVERILLVV